MRVAHSDQVLVKVSRSFPDQQVIIGIEMDVDVLMAMELVWSGRV